MQVDLRRCLRRPAWPAWVILVVLAWVTLGLVAIALGAHLGIETPLCVFKRVTHLPCPTCGMTRAAGHILHGRFVEGFLTQPLMVTAAVAMALLVLFRLIFARRVELTWGRLERRLAWAAVAALALLNWGYVIRFVG